MSKLFSTAALLQRPHVIEEGAAEYWSAKVRAWDGRAFQRRQGSALDVIARVARLGRARPEAMDDDDVGGAPEPVRPAAYAPYWIGDPDDELECGMTLKSGVALLNVDTPLVERGFGICGVWFHGYESIQAALEAADADPRVKAVFIRWDCPGGVVAPGLYDLTTYMQARRAEGKKPLWSFCDMACSGAYWLAAQSDRIVAPAVGLVGSIGAVWTHTSFQGADEKDGIKVTAVQFGAHKTDGAAWKDLDDGAKARIQAMIDGIGEDFLAAVAAGRGSKLTAEQARATQADVYNAQDRDPARSGAALGLVDEVMSERDAFAALAESVSTSSLPRPAAVSAGSAAAASAQPAADAADTQETTMKLSQRIAAAMAAGKTKGETDEQFNARIAALAEGAEAAADDEGECECEGEEDCECDQEDDGAEAAAEDDKPDGKKAKKTDAMSTAREILALPEAKGREALAQELAFEKGMTVATARRLLAKSPKGTANARKDVDLSSNAAGGGNAGDEASEGQKIAARALANYGWKKPAPAAA